MGADRLGNKQNRLKKSVSGTGPETGRNGKTDSLATAYGVWEKDGEITFISNLPLAKPCGSSSAKRNKKSGEIKPDG